MSRPVNANSTRVPTTCATSRNGSERPRNELGCFPERHPQCSPLVQSLQRQREVQTQRTVQEKAAERIAPDEIEDPPAAFHGVDGQKTEGVIAEVREEEAPEDQPGNQTGVAQCNRSIAKARTVHGFPRNMRPRTPGSAPANLNPLGDGLSGTVAHRYRIALPITIGRVALPCAGNEVAHPWQARQARPGHISQGDRREVSLIGELAPQRETFA